jgi:predicted ArsR family transcriptional regulator
MSPQIVKCGLEYLQAPRHAAGTRMAAKLQAGDAPMLRKQFLQTSRGRIAEILQRGPATVEQLASALRLTPNAVRAQLIVMERDGLIQRAGMVAGTTRPSHTYELTPTFEQLLSSAYVPLLTHLVRTFAQGLERDRLQALMRQTGKSLAADVGAGRPLPGDFHLRVKKANEFLKIELGAVTHVAKQNGGFVIEGKGCPLAAITDKEPSVCVAVESLLEELIGAKVRECCNRDSRPRCCFEIHPPPG